jgi:hypothetical protein
MAGFLGFIRHWSKALAGVGALSTCNQRLNLAFTQDHSEWFVTFRTVEKPDFKLHLLAAFVRSTSHCPFLFR